MPTLLDLISQLWDDEAILGPAADLRDGTTTLVQAGRRVDAKARYVAYRSREHVRTVLTRGESNDVELTDGEATDLRSQVTTDATSILPQLETFYLSAIANNPSGRLDLEPIEAALEAPATRTLYRRPRLGMVNPRLNRTQFIWDIVWGLVTNDKRWLTQPASLLEHIERRLRKIERMRYNVSIAPDNRTLTTNGEDGHTLRMFEYPRGAFSSRVGGQGAVHWVGSSYFGFFKLYGVVAGQSLSPGEQRGYNAPASAIQALFATPLGGWRLFGNRTINYCDRVIQILHLEEVASHLIRVLGLNGANVRMRALIDEVTARDSRIWIESSWVSPTSPISMIGSGSNVDLALGRVGDPFFEHSSAVRLDQLVPGDQLIIRSHPAFFAFSTRPWKLENFLVMSMSGRELPAAIELQGHGAGPWDFIKAQGMLFSMSKGFGGGLQQAQEEIERRDLTARAATLHDDPPYAPFVWDSEDGYTGVLEFRNEWRSVGRGAWWGRWRIPWSGVEFDRWRDGLTAGEEGREWTEYQFDNPNAATDGSGARFGQLWEVPYVTGIAVDVARRRVTLSGHRLEPSTVNGIYLVSHTRRQYASGQKNTPTRGFSPSDDPGSSMLSVLGQWEEGGVARHLFSSATGAAVFDQGTIYFYVPSTFDLSPNYWRPVLVTPIRMEIRGQCAFRWPPDAAPSLIGHSAFNVGYFPMFESRGDGSWRRVKVSYTEAVAVDLLKYYVSSRPQDTISVIRARPPAW